MESFRDLTQQIDAAKEAGNDQEVARLYTQITLEVGTLFTGAGLGIKGVSATGRGARLADDLQGSLDNIAGAVGIRGNNVLLVNGRVPTVRNGQFREWFDQLSPAELDSLWLDPTIRSQIEARIRQPGGLHEWCMACRAPEFRRWGVAMSEIQRFRSSTKELTWIHPDTGFPGGHGREGSGQFHNELRDIIDNSSSIGDFNSGIERLRDRWQIDPDLLPDLPKSE